MEESQYLELLQFFKGKISKNEQYQQWAAQFREKYNHVYKGDRRVVPIWEKNWIMSIYHDDPTMAHQGADAMYWQILKRYIWPSMREDIKNYVKTCFRCQQRGTLKQNNRKRTIAPQDVFERWGIDIVGPLLVTETGNRYIVVAVDYFTRWPEAKLLKEANARAVAQFIYEEIICRHGAPRVIQSDQGSHFVNEVIKGLTERFRVKHSLSSPYHPQSNGLVERFNKTLCKGIAKVAENMEDWEDYIQPVLFAYRTKKLRITGQSPYKLVYGKEPCLVDELGEHGGSIIERLLEITDEVLQLRKQTRRIIREN